MHCWTHGVCPKLNILRVQLGYAFSIQLVSLGASSINKRAIRDGMRLAKNVTTTSVS